MKILALDTATRVGGVALMKDENLLAEYRMEMTMAHSERLMVLVDRVLKESGLSFGELDAVALSIGPGSFTGLRVGVSTVKGLVAETAIRVVPVPTLEAIAWNLPAARTVICPMMDAKKQEVYTALFSSEVDGMLKREMEDQVAAPRMMAEHVFERVREGDTRVIFLGDGALQYRGEIEAVMGGQAIVAPAPLSDPRPAVVGWLGLQRLNRGESVDPATLVPAYVRRSDAEINWEKGMTPKKLKLSGRAGSHRRR